PHISRSRLSHPPPRSTPFPYTTLFRSQNVLHYSPMGAGIRFLPLSLVAFFVAPLAGRLSVRMPPRSRRGGRAHEAEGEDERALRSEEHTSELQSLAYLVCRLLLEKKK